MPRNMLPMVSLDSSWLWGLIGVTASIVTVLIAVVSGRRTLTWSQRQILTVEDHKSLMPKIQILYDGYIVEQLSVVRFVIWNSGWPPVQSSDLDEDPRYALRVQTTSPSVTIRDARVVSTNARTSDFSIEPLADGSAALLKFRYFKRNNGVIFDVIHSGTHVSEVRICVEPIRAEIHEVSSANVDMLRIGTLIDLSLSRWP